MNPDSIVYSCSFRYVEDMPESYWRISLSARIGDTIVVNVEPENSVEFFRRGDCHMFRAGENGIIAVMNVGCFKTIQFTAGRHSNDDTMGVIHTFLPHNASFDRAIEEAAAFVEKLSNGDTNADSAE